MFKIIIEEYIGMDKEQKPVQRYEQSVERLDMQSVINVVNRKPRKPRTKKGGEAA